MTAWLAYVYIRGSAMRARCWCRWRARTRVDCVLTSQRAQESSGCSDRSMLRVEGRVGKEARYMDEGRGRGSLESGLCRVFAESCQNSQNGRQVSVFTGQSDPYEGCGSTNAGCVSTRQTPGVSYTL